jgi:hypothetical protein
MESNSPKTREQLDSLKQKKREKAPDRHVRRNTRRADERGHGRRERIFWAG